MRYQAKATQQAPYRVEHHMQGLVHSQGSIWLVQADNLQHNGSRVPNKMLKQVRITQSNSNPKKTK